MTRKTVTRRAVLYPTVVVQLVAIGCGAMQPRLLGVIDSTDADGVMVHLSHSLNQVANGSVEVIPLVADLVISGNPPGTDGRFVDVATFANGTIVSLDHVTGLVQAYAPTGRMLQSFAGIDDLKGDAGTVRTGFRNGGPVAVVTVNNHVVVFQRLLKRSLTVFNHNGYITAAKDAPVPGDWQTIGYRKPRLMVDPPHRGTAEDWTRRLIAIDDTSFAVHLQPDEVANGTDTTSHVPTAVLVHFNMALQVIDTLDESRGAPLSSGIPLVANQLTTVQEPIYAGRPLWAAGEGWLARGHGNTNSVVVSTGKSELTVDWPIDTTAVSVDAKVDRVMWNSRYQDYLSNSYEVRISRRERRRRYASYAERLLFATTVPQVQALYGAGDCLWLAGFAPTDSPRGVARTWVAVRVPIGHVVGVFQLPRTAVRLRHIDAMALYATSYDEETKHQQLMRFPLPAGTCSGDDKARALVAGDR